MVQFGNYEITDDIGTYLLSLVIIARIYIVNATNTLVSNEGR
jgi:hypothetical protein